MEFSFRSTLILGLLILQESLAGIPSSIQKCRPADVVCIAKTTTKILNDYPNGNAELGLRRIEPIHLDEMVVARTNGNNPLNLNFKFTNLDVFGLSKLNVTKVVGFEKDLKKSKFEMYVIIPELRIKGHYEANGRILLLPIVGNGTADLQLKNFKSGVKLKFAIIKEDGKERISILKMKVHNEPELMSIKLDNLFNGNKAVGDELNKVINDNWRDVWTELESGINEGYSDIIKLLLSEVLQVISYDEFYID
ncbi:protein takeout-like [Eupeodes corollae]|uniref:protein takeout-like n=1 Tax=Eupeodes corollae TaxID=290404 RepID=UPI0024918FE0|nr:protein takeout-like [Eupeodes corollae]XP_055904271.1 protein takeout-like [Eupeodes corollae]XP_055904272.1 protein takeout-like [Eupeodes corollae]